MTPAPAAWPLWATHPHWRLFLQQLTTYYTNRTGEHRWNAAFREFDGVACMVPAARTLFLHPQLMGPLHPHAWHRHSLSRRDALDLTLRGLVAHESGHVRFSCAMPEGVLGEVWNSLEDERVERLMARSHRFAQVHLGRAFDHLGDQQLVSAHAAVQRAAEQPLAWWVLYWRFLHDHPTLNVRPADPRWTEARPLVEAAWTAPDSETVVAIAQALVDLLGLTEPQGLPVSASGAGSDDREESAQDSAAPAQASEPGRDEGPAADQAPGPGPDDTPMAGADGAPASPGEQPAASGGADESGEPAPAGGDSGPNDGSTSDGGDGQAVGGPPQTTGTDPAGPSAGGAEWPPGGAVTEPQAPALSLAPRQEPLGGTPHSPVDPVTAESMARSVAALLQARTAPGAETSSQSRGRFSYERFVSGAQRTFRTRTAPTRWAQIQVTFVGDRSSSMSSRWGEATRLQAVHAACYVFVRAGQLSRSPTHAILFSDQVQRVLGEQPPSVDAPAVISASTAFVPSGGTCLSPALRQALARSVPPGTHHLVVIACDGELKAADKDGVQRMVRGAPGHVAFLPLLIGADTSLSAWRCLFPGAQVARTPHALVHLTLTVVQGLRRGPWRARPVPGPRR